MVLEAPHFLVFYYDDVNYNGPPYIVNGDLWNKYHIFVCKLVQLHCTLNFKTAVKFYWFEAKHNVCVCIGFMEWHMWTSVYTPMNYLTMEGIQSPGMAII